MTISSTQPGEHLGTELPGDGSPGGGPVTGSRIIEVAEAETGERIDRLIARRLPALSRSRVKALIEAGHLSVEGATINEPSTRVKACQSYLLSVPEPTQALPEAQALPLEILHEDAALLVLDKPAGLVVHPAPGNPAGTLVNALLAHAGAELTGIGGEMRPGIVHRPDKDTSGVMVVAKSERARQALTVAFASRREDLERAYLALVWGLPAPPAGTIEAPIGRHPVDRKRMAVVPEGRGKPALTRYVTERTFGTACALLRCRLATGRTHQIRVHLSHRGHPLVGDPLYCRRVPSAARTLPEPLRAALLGFPRQALHAATLGFRHPVTGAALRFESALPADMAELLRRLSAYADG